MRLLAGTLLAGLVMTGCTFVTPPGDGGMGGQKVIIITSPEGGLPIAPPTPTPAKTNLLFVVNMHRSTANLAMYYADIINGMVDQLTALKLTVEAWGVAATYPDVTGTRLLFGRRDTSVAAIPAIAEAMAAKDVSAGSPDYAALLLLLNKHAANIAPSDVMPALKLLAGTGYFDGDRAVDSEPETAVRLGANAGIASLPSNMGGLERDALFASPRSLFIVVYLQSLQRPCALNSAQCQVDGKSARDIFLDTDADGNATWLKFQAGALRPEQIIHVAITTDEGVPYTSFRSSCSAVEGFPINLLDVMEPSPALFFKPLIDELARANSGTGHMVDLCNYMGVDAAVNIKALARTVASMVASRK